MFTMTTMLRLFGAFLVLIALATKADGECSNINSLYITNETAPNGTNLIHATKAPEDKVTFGISNNTKIDFRFHANLSAYFNLTEQQTFFTIDIAKTLDLEFFWIEFNNATLTTIELIITCQRNNSPPTTFTPNIVNAAVNEFDPQFKGAPFETSVRENETWPDYTVLDMFPNVMDQDIPSPTFFFSIEPHNIHDADGRAYFSIHNINGKIWANRMPDFDNPNINRKMFLNVSVSDDTANTIRKSFTSVTITLLDADDQAPYFIFPDCPAPCFVPPYEAFVETSDKFALAVIPVDISAKDPDTLGTELVYSIASGNDQGIFTINPRTGAVSQLKSVDETKLDDAQFRLVIKVKKDLNYTDLSSLAILTVKVIGRVPAGNDSIPPIIRHITEAKGGNSLLIPVIVLGIFLLLLIIAIVFLVIIIRKLRKRKAVVPDNSEPQTEEEDLHSDRSDAMNSRAFSNERLVFDGKATIGIGTLDFPETPLKKRGLPPLPLRDTATETEQGDGKKKKRSRKRNKNKEPEIFDGTREYNMGADPEFFDSTDKSKVKRSQRSYDKKSDPSSWITVPNDQPSSGAE